MKLRYFSKRRRRQNEAAIFLGTSFRAVRPSRPWVGMVICGYVSRPLPAARPRLATAAPAGPDSVWPRTGQIRVAGPPGIGPGRGPDAALARLVLVKRPSRPWPLVMWITSGPDAARWARRGPGPPRTGQTSESAMAARDVVRVEASRSLARSRARHLNPKCPTAARPLSCRAIAPLSGPGS